LGGVVAFYAAFHKTGGQGTRRGRGHNNPVSVCIDFAGEACCRTFMGGSFFNTSVKSRVGGADERQRGAGEDFEPDNTLRD
jgi:hypothetical protein